MYGSIGFTRRDRTPKHWKEDYKLTPYAKKLIREIELEKDRLHKEYENLPLDISDEEERKAFHELGIKLDELLEKEDEIRKMNPKG